MIDVVWFSENPDAISRGYWDQGVLEELFAGRLWRPPGPVEFAHRSASELPEGRGAVVVVPARWHAGREVKVRKFVDRLPWCLLILTGDEENAFDRASFDPLSDRMRVWVQTPMPGTVREGERCIGDGPPPDARLLGDASWDKSQDWFFAGQVNNPGREDLVKQLRQLPPTGRLETTDTFGSGLPYAEYLAELARSRVVPCPGGNFTPDTFRLFETLEAGCAPVVRNDPYWELLGNPPLVRSESWLDGIRTALAGWPDTATRASCWYQRYKRELARLFYADLLELAGEPAPGDEPADQVTVLMPTSSTPADPSTEIIEQTVESLRASLPGAQLIVMLDGLHPDHRERRGAYAEYRRRVAWLCEHRWPNALPLLFEEHRHQATMTRRALDEVHTPQVLFVEHDAPLVGEVPWRELTAAVRSGRADAIRLHHETGVLPEHAHMMLDAEPQDVEGAPLLRTSQWSQRPHLASAAFYRRVLRDYFTDRSRTMIEDVLYGVIETEWREFGLAGWDRFRLWMYAPEGDMKRSTHLDARQGEPKVPMVFR